ncbi:MAG TPA: ABC transporter permease [Acidimicrobiales bacterium]|nr:ABC transporter permease [Acidimicrobiales bacterium]
MALRLLPENARLRAIVVGVGAVVATLAFTQLVLPGRGGGRGTPGAILFQGLVLGLAYCVFTTGMILVFRAIRIVNFAQGPLGAAGSILSFGMIQYTSVPFPIAILLGLAVSTTIGGVIGVFMLRFFSASRLYLTVITVVATTAIIGPVFIAVGSAPFFPDANEITAGDRLGPDEFRRLLPFPGLKFHVGSFPLTFGFSELFTIELAVIALIGVALFLRYTRTGVAMRALAENPERASLLGIGVGGISILVWMVAGLLDGVGVTMARTGAPGIGIGLEAILPFLVAAVLARFRSLPIAWSACIVIGVVRSAWNFSLRDDQQAFFLVLFVVMGVALLVQRRAATRSESGDVSWAGSTEPRPIPKELSRITSLRLAKYGLYAVGLLLVSVFPFVAPLGRTVLLSVVFINAIAVLSLVVLTGWAGQVSLGQYAFVAIGAVVGGALSARLGVPFWFAVPIASAITAVIAVVVGLPALRLKGLLLMVTTFAFALAVRGLLFDKRYFGWLLPAGVDRPTLFFFNFEDERSMYFLSVLAFVSAAVVVTNLRRSRTGRLLIALRENENNVAAFGVSVVRAKLLSLAIAGALAGFAGAVLAHQQRGVTPEAFGADQNVAVFVQAVLGGVSSVGGAVLGSAYFVLTGQFLGSNAVLASFVRGFGPLLIVFLAPGGLISLVNQARDSVLRIVAQRRRIVVPSLFADYDPDALERQLIPLGEADHVGGLAALPLDDRFALESGLYAGRGERIIEKLAPVKTGRETAAIGAAARAAEDYEPAAIGPGPEES